MFHVSTLLPLDTSDTQHVSGGRGRGQWEVGKEGGRMHAQITYCCSNSLTKCIVDILHIVCTQIVHDVHTNYLLYMHKLFTIYKQIVYYIQTNWLLYTKIICCIQTNCLLYTNKLFTVCTWIIYCIHTGAEKETHWQWHSGHYISGMKYWQKCRGGEELEV